MKRSVWFTALAVAGAGVALWVVAKPGAVLSQDAAAKPSRLGDGIAEVRIELGLLDRAGREWKGKLSVTGGEVLTVRNWRPRPGDTVTNTGWTLSTWKAPNFVKRPWEKPFNEPQQTYIRQPGVLMQVRGSAATALSIETADGSFEVKPFAMEYGEDRRELAGQVSVRRVAAMESVSNPAANSDFATVAAAANGDLWTAWVEFANGKNAVMARRRSAGQWSAIEKVSGDHTDVFVVKAARDGMGGVVFAWSAQVNGNFDVYARRWDGRTWSAIERLSDAPQPDIYVTLATDAEGGVWAAWQGFRNGKSDIVARRWHNTWAAAETVSTSPANDWAPSLAADRAGRVWAAWDTYDKGNYDVVVRRWEKGAWGEVTPVAATGKFEAYPSVVCDGQNRLWIAWNEAGFEWGKDTGFLPKIEGTALYSWRVVKTAVLTSAGLQEPAGRFEESMPAALRGFNDLPSLAADANGRVWMSFRHRRIRQPDMPSDTPLHRANWEIFVTRPEAAGWSAPVQLPASYGRQDMRTGIASASDGLYVAYPYDRRDFEDYLYQRGEVNVARIPVMAAGVPPVLRPAPHAEIKWWPIHPNERADLDRIHSHVMTVAGRRLKIYRGDIHRHTEFSMDGNNDGSLLDTYRYAMDAAELDFLMVSDHNGAAGPDEPYVNFLLQQMADVFHVPGTFVPFYGYERSVNYPNGHRNVVFTKRGNPTLPIPQAEQKGAVGAKALYEYLKKYDGIAVSHTSASNMGTDWRDNDPDVEPLVEIYQGDRVSVEYLGAPKAANAENPNSAPGGFRPAGYVWNAWAKGYKLGVQASSDHLSTHISYACTLSEEFTRESLLNAMRRRQSYGATDNIILDYRISAPDGDHVQGASFQTSGPFELKVSVIGTKPIRQIDIIRSNQFLMTSHPNTKEAALTFRDQQPQPGESYYYVRVQQHDDQMAWSSPIWIKR
ncbi:MAG: DUF3604 domain-containing protein [Bryobacterales bacterium]|nr:DUF3604 domain-containing protein [Bryobacterales bacterium]